MAQPQGDNSHAAAADSLSWYARELYNDLRLTPMLRQLLTTSSRLAGAMGGSISIVDAEAGRYTKVAELGTACRLGQSFALREGVTGEVVRRRRPVVLESYREIAQGHMPTGHPAGDGAVVGLPIWWRDDVVAVNVVFAGTARTFSREEVDHLELVTQVVAPGVVVAVEREMPSRGGSRRERQDRAAPQADPSVEQVAWELVDLAGRAAVDRGLPDGPLHVTVLTAGDRPRLLVRRDDAAPPFVELVDEGGAVGVQQVKGAGSLPHGAAPSLNGLSGPHGPGSAGTQGAGASPSPFSLREQQVAQLLAEGLSDRAIAEQFCLSPKTVEKHVSAVLRKTGTTSRTAAVVCCMQAGWLPPATAPGPPAG